MFRYAIYEAKKLNDLNSAQPPDLTPPQPPTHHTSSAPVTHHVGAVSSQGVSHDADNVTRQEKERLLRRALPDAQSAAANWIHSNGMYGKPPSRFIRDITRILFDPSELASNRVTTLDKKWVSIICKEAIDAYPNHSHATSGAVRNIISTMCSEARVSLGYSKSKNSQRKPKTQINHLPNPNPNNQNPSPNQPQRFRVISQQ